MSIYTQRNSTVVLGTSLSSIGANGFPDGSSRGAQSWFGWGSLLSNSRIIWTWNAGLLGDTVGGMLTRFNRDVKSKGPAWCHVEVGTNDAYVLATPVAAFAAQYRQLVLLCQQANIKPVLHTVPMRSDVFSALVPQYNAFITRLAQEQGFPIVDAYSALLDPTTGLTNVANTVDGLHPSAAGARLWGQAAANTALIWYPPFLPILGETNNGDDLNLVGNPLFLTNVAGVGTNWTQVGVGTPTTPVTAPPQLGNWQRIASNPDNAQVTVNSAAMLPGSLWTPGVDAVSFAGWVQSSCPAGAAGALVELGFFPSGLVYQVVLQLPGVFGPNLFYGEVVPPVGSTLMEVFMGLQGGTGGNDFCQIAQPTSVVLSRSPVAL